ncbi:MAG TPA: hypothetical protein VG652_08525 [Gaiellaceae bacterium]|nr:hypothetical protein [Gaiellaceae bacterium]
MLSICCLSGGPTERLAALLTLLRPVADELVIAVDDRVDRDRLGAVSELADVLVAYPFAEPVERPFGWLHSLCRGDWIFRIDDDEVPSGALLDALRAPDERLTHAWVPRRWLWDDGYLASDPWAPDWQLRLVRPDAARFPGQMHIPVQASGPHAYLEEAALYHLDLVTNDREARAAKVNRYEHVRPGLRLGELPLNAAYYLPELRRELLVEEVPSLDAPLIRFVIAAAGAGQEPASEPVEIRVATRTEVDAHWAEAPLPDEDYCAEIELGRAPSPICGEVREIDVHVTNLGSTVWPGGRDALPEIRLSSRWKGLELPEQQLRSAFPSDVAPGETVLVPLSFRAPDEPGSHVLIVDLVHERHRWFGVDVEVDVVVRPERRAVVLVSQPPGEEVFDRRVDDLLGRIDPSLQPVLVGPKPDWLRDRFGIEAHADQPPPAESVFVVAAGPRRRRLRLELQARELRFESWRGQHKASGRPQGRAMPVKQILLSGLAALGIVGGAAGFIDLNAAAGKSGATLPKVHQSVLHQLESVGTPRGLTATELGTIRR